MIKKEKGGFWAAFFVFVDACSIVLPAGIDNHKKK